VLKFTHTVAAEGTQARSTGKIAMHVSVSGYADDMKAAGWRRLKWAGKATESFLQLWVYSFSERVHSFRRVGGVVGESRLNESLIEPG
jgi:hypothetical protein